MFQFDPTPKKPPPPPPRTSSLANSPPAAQAAARTLSLHPPPTARTMTQQPVDLSSLRVGIPSELPPHPGVHPDPSVPRAPHRRVALSPDELVLAVQNALRYFPEHQHATLAPEFAQELKDEGHIYMHRCVLARFADGSPTDWLWQELIFVRGGLVWFLDMWLQLPTCSVRDEGVPDRRVPGRVQASSSSDAHDHGASGLILSGLSRFFNLYTKNHSSVRTTSTTAWHNSPTTS